jgi:6-phosphogluconate dehydrogenase
MNSHFGLFWKIHVDQKLTKQMTKKPTNPSTKLHKLQIRHIQGQSCYHSQTFYKKEPYLEYQSHTWNINTEKIFAITKHICIISQKNLNKFTSSYCTTKFQLVARVTKYTYYQMQLYEHSSNISR